MAFLAGCLALQVGAPEPAPASPGPTLEEGPLPPPAPSRRGSPYLDSRLVQLAEIERHQGREAASRFAAANAIRLDADQRVRVLIHPATSPSTPAAPEIVARVTEAWEAGRAPRVVLEATHESVLKYVPLSALKRHALDLN